MEQRNRVLTSEEFDALVAKAHWQSAKTTEDVAPHQYNVLDWDKDDLTRQEFWDMVATIKTRGRFEEWTPPQEWVRRWGGRPMTNHYLYMGDWAYWFTHPRRSIPMLNREHVSVQLENPTRRVVQPA